MTPDERRTKMQADKQAMEEWAKQNGIDLNSIMLPFGKGMGMRGHMMGK